MRCPPPLPSLGILPGGIAHPSRFPSDFRVFLSITFVRISARARELGVGGAAGCGQGAVSPLAPPPPGMGATPPSHPPILPGPPQPRHGGY